MTEQRITPTAQLPPHEEPQVIDVSLREVMLGGVMVGIGALLVGGSLIGWHNLQKRRQVTVWFDRIERLATTVLLDPHPGKEAGYALPAHSTE